MSRLQLANYRGFAGLELEFDPRLTVLVGVNGGGKSSVLDALAMVLRGVVEGEGALAGAVASLRNGAARGSVGTSLTPPSGSAWATSLGVPGAAASLEVRIKPGGVGFVGAPLSMVAADGSVPSFAHYTVARGAADTTPGSTAPSTWSPERAWEHAFDASANFEALFAWFREREDLENERIRRDGAGLDVRLDAVRSAIARAMPGFNSPRVRRPDGSIDEHPAFRRPALVIDKSGEMLAFNQLSDGERSLLAMIADIARRLAIANPAGDPLAGHGIVLIDEIELHLHPKWQADVLPRLLAVFPSLQFIVTTHSPLVLTHVKAEQVRVLHEFQVFAPPNPVEGREAGAILGEVFDTDPLPETTRDAVARISRLIDHDDFERAREELARLAELLGDRDAEVARLRATIELLAS